MTKLPQKITNEIKKEDSDTKIYSMSIGGVHLTSRGIHMTEVGVLCRYDVLGYKHVQALWEILADERIQKAQKDFDNAVGPVLIELGNKYGVMKGRLTLEDAKKVTALGELK